MNNSYQSSEISLFDVLIIFLRRKKLFMLCFLSFLSFLVIGAIIVFWDNDSMFTESWQAPTFVSFNTNTNDRQSLLSDVQQDDLVKQVKQKASSAVNFKVMSGSIFGSFVKVSVQMKNKQQARVLLQKLWDVYVVGVNNYYKDWLGSKKILLTNLKKQIASNDMESSGLVGYNFAKISAQIKTSHPAVRGALHQQSVGYLSTVKIIGLLLMAFFAGCAAVILAESASAFKHYKASLLESLNVTLKHGKDV